MHEDGQQILELMFQSGETICVSNSKFGYHSIPLEKALDGPLALIPPLVEGKTIEEQLVHCDSADLTLVALNPIEGYRRDANVKKYRNFLIELDVGTTDEQMEYIRRSGLPYSAMIFSGNKSIHTLISLTKDLPDEKTYRAIATWILSILPLADQNIKNPSRSIRIPGAEREIGKFQQLYEFKGKVELKALTAWLNKYPDSKPKERRKPRVSGEEDIDMLKKPWVVEKLDNAKAGFPGIGRNQGWFQLASNFRNAGFSEERTIEILEKYFEEEHDFKEKEFLNSISQAFKYRDEKQLDFLFSLFYTGNRMKRDDEIKRLVKYANALGASVTFCDSGRPDSSAEWTIDGKEITIYEKKQYSKTDTILSLVHELGHLLNHIHRNDRVQDEEFGEALGSDELKKARRKILRVEKQGTEYWYTVYKDTNLQIPLWKLYAAMEYDLWQYEVFYETGKFPKGKEQKKKRKTVKVKHRNVKYG